MLKNIKYIFFRNGRYEKNLVNLNLEQCFPKWAKLPHFEAMSSSKWVKGEGGIRAMVVLTLTLYTLKLMIKSQKINEKRSQVFYL